MMLLNDTEPTEYVVSVYLRQIRKKNIINIRTYIHQQILKMPKNICSQLTGCLIRGPGLKTHVCVMSMINLFGLSVVSAVSKYS